MATNKNDDYGSTYDPNDRFGVQYFLQQDLNREDAGDGLPNPSGDNLPLAPLPGAPSSGAGATGYYDYVDRNQGRDPLEVLAGAYPEFLGRTAGPGEAALHYTGSAGYGSGGLRGGVGEIYNSPEAVAYRSRPAATSGGDTGGGGTGGTGGGGTTGVDYANPYTGGAAASTRAPRVIQRGDQFVLTEHGNERVLQPNEVADARTYVTQYATQNPTGFIQPGAPGYAAGQATTNEGYTPPRITGQGGTTGGGGTGYGGVQLAPRTGGGGGQWGGFNTERALAGGDPNSIKDAFYRFGQGFQFDPAGKSKEEIGAFLRSQMPAAQAYGLQIDDVRGDQIHVVTAENPEGTWVDVVGNAGGQGASPWQWIDQSYLGDMGGGGGGGAGGGGAATAGGGGEDPLTAGLGGSALFQQLMAALLESIKNNRSPTNQSTLQSTLNG